MAKEKKGQLQLVQSTEVEVEAAEAPLPAPITVDDKGILNMMVVMPWAIRRQILTAACAVPGEIAGWAEAEVNGGEIRITRIAIPEQTAGGADAEISAEQTFELAKLGELDISKAIVSWHSHVNMGAVPSAIDEDLYRKLSHMMPVFVGIVMNKKNEWHLEVRLRTTVGILKVRPVFMTEYPLVEGLDKVEELAKARCKERRYRGGQTVSISDGKCYINGKLVTQAEAKKFLADETPDWEILGAECFPFEFEAPCDEDTCEERAKFRIHWDADGTSLYKKSWLCAKCTKKAREALHRGAAKIDGELKRRGEKEIPVRLS